MDDSVIIIFGATGGIGEPLARKLAPYNKNLILISRNQEKLQVLSNDIKCTYKVLDARNEEEVQAVINHVYETYGKIDGVCNLVGSFFIKPLHLTSLKDFQEVLNTNLITSFNILKASTEKMGLRNKGSIILMSSCAAKIGLVHHEAISAAKGALVSLVKSAAASYASKSLRINAIAPGLVDTPLSKPITSSEQALKTSLNFHPLHRIGKPCDIVACIEWLLSDLSSWVTGQTISIDGGLSDIKLKNS